MLDTLTSKFHTGWATDLKTVSEEMIKKRVERTGDGTHRIARENDENNNVAEKVDHSDLWGWGNIELNSPSQNIFSNLSLLLLPNR